MSNRQDSSISAGGMFSRQQNLKGARYLESFGGNEDDQLEGADSPQKRLFLSSTAAADAVASLSNCDEF